MAKNWFVRRDDEEFGPFTPDEIRKRAAVGWLREIDFIRPNNESAWIPTTRIKDLQFGSTNATKPPVKSPPKKAPLPRASGERIYVDEQGVFVSATKYRVATVFGSIESDLNGYDSASLRENKPLFFGKPTYTVVLHGWGVGEYEPSLTHADQAFVRRVVEALNIAIAETLAKDESPAVESSQFDNKPVGRPFKILAPLLGDEEIQFLIIMLVADATLESETDLWFEYSMGDASQTCGKGPSFSISDLHDKLLDAGILACNRQGQFVLTALGREFADWLISNGYRAEYFASPLGFWGKKPVNEFWEL